MALASLALAVVIAAPGPSEPADLVRAIRVEADAPQQLRKLVSFGLGQPLDREAVRRSIELFFATGRFEDVPVDLVREPEGVTVVFRPRPAPLLRAVRVEGDRVLGARQIMREARLRPGEALWTARLERAARDVALALARRGHLEALVEPAAVRVPGGADAVFRVRAGPQVRVGRVFTAASEPVAALGIGYLAKPHAAAVYDKEKADGATEAMRQALVRAGHWRASVELRATYDPGRALIDLAFHVEAGPRVTVEVHGAADAGLLSGLRELLSEGAATPDSLEAGREHVEGRLRAEGHRDAVVHVRDERGAAVERILYDVEAGPRAIAATVTIRGADPALLAGLRTQPGQPIEDARLDEDSRTLVQALRALGHFNARVDVEVPDGGGDLAVLFDARPGPRAVVRAVEVAGPPLPVASEDKGPEELTIRPGVPYRVADLARSRDTLLAAWRRAGYLDAKVRPEVAFSPAQDEARVRFVIDPGSRALVGQVVLSGLGQTRAAAVEREIVLRPREAFSFERVLESQRRLSSLGIFERVSIAELGVSREQRDVVVSLQEAPRTSVSWGLGYSAQDRVRGSVELTRRNLGGMGRTASLFARASFRGSRLLASFREPWLFGRKLDSSVQGFWEEEHRTSFNFNRKGAVLQAGRNLDARTSLLLRYVLQDTAVYDLAIPIADIDRQYRTYVVSGPSASIVFDSRDDPLEPKRGLFLGADLQLSSAKLGGEGFLRGYLQAASVRRLRADLVLVLSGRVGLADGFGPDATLPEPERFFAGGDFGLRGFATDAVGPLATGSNGKQYGVGGNALILGGAEMRYSLGPAFQIASFLDVGNVYPAVEDVDLGALRRSAGLGVRYRTPVGPVRLDWGYVLDPTANEARRWNLHLTIGHAF